MKTSPSALPSPPRPVLRVAALAALLALPFAACSDSTGPRPFTDPRDVTFDPSLGVDLDRMVRTDSGLYFQDLEEGEGPGAAAGDLVVVAYRGWLANGLLFDQSDGWDFPLGVGFVIPGWDEGVLGMRVGGERLLVVPPDLGFGHSAVGSIPPNSVLVFSVRLVEIVSEGSDSGS